MRFLKCLISYIFVSIGIIRLIFSFSRLASFSRKFRFFCKRSTRHGFVVYRFPPNVRNSGNWTNDRGTRPDRNSIRDCVNAISEFLASRRVYIAIFALAVGTCPEQNDPHFRFRSCLNEPCARVVFRYVRDTDVGHRDFFSQSWLFFLLIFPRSKWSRTSLSLSLSLSRVVSDERPTKLSWINHRSNSRAFE